MRIGHCVTLVLVLFTGLLVAFDERPAGDDPGPRVDFVRDIRPILSERCYRCHGAKKQEAGVRWDRKALAFATADSGHTPVVAGDPDKSRLVQLITATNPKDRMPREGDPLSAQQIDLIKRWVAQGAPWPEGLDQTDAPSHWSFVSPKRPVPPRVSSPDWAKNLIDRFILARLEKEGLGPSPEADRYTLIRRAYLDLTGLPPGPAEVAAFAADMSPDAYERLVDRLLDDPGYGERWGKVWLDLARYADSSGYGSDQLRPNIWPYRDYVINAFNRNDPYDRFTTEQLAGDLLPNPTTEQIIACAFHRNTMTNVEGGTDDEEFRVAAVKDRVNTTVQVWMGLTMGCAQCHTHKYDPITQREYYQLYAVFNETQDRDLPDESPTFLLQTPQQKSRIAMLEKHLGAARKELESLGPQLAEAQGQWESKLPRPPVGWKPWKEEAASSTAGTKVERLPDGSLLFQGGQTMQDTYNLTYLQAPQGLTAIRLEALPHESLPGGGPGRAADGNFTLGEFDAKFVPADNAPPVARYIRIENRGTKILSLAEVQVFRGDQNIAPTGKATQLSTAFEGAAQRAIDGNTDGNYSNSSVSHTADQQDRPWWELDLGSPGPMDRVVIWNRTDGGLGDRLKDFVVSALDESRRVVWQSRVGKPPSPSLALETAGPFDLAWSSATADHAQPGFDAAKAIDGLEQTGWAIAPQFGKAHEILFKATAPLGERPGKLSLTLQHAGVYSFLGRLRVSTTDRDPGGVLPDDVIAALNVAPGNRTPQQRERLSDYYRSISPLAAQAKKKITDLEKQLASAKQAGTAIPVMRELPADKRRVSRMMVKGNFLTPGDPVEPALPAAFGVPSGNTGLSIDRLAVTRWLLDESNPLTARVAVNRYWAQLFGLGLVETEEDFGTQGTPPSHPELLDWLATEYRRNGWNTKAILRLMVTSATYRQSSRVTPELLEKDSRNRLLARGPRFRLSAEAVRDQALAVAGLLSRKIGGPSVYPPQPAGLWAVAFNGQRNWDTSPGEDRFRRGIYTFWRRTVPYPSMLAFDATSNEVCTIRRMRTNTPLQVFVTLNDPVYVEAAQALASRIIREGGSTAEDRIRLGLELCTSRPAGAEQIARIAELYRTERKHYETDASAAEELSKPAAPGIQSLPIGVPRSEMAAWTVVANLLLNLDAVLMKS